MKKLERQDIVDYETWSDRRDAEQEKLFAHKALRRVHVGDHLTFLFETTETVRWQVQEMMRVERIVRESDIRHEIDTYNDLLGRPGELGCSVLIEVEDAERRPALLREWLRLPHHLYVALDDGTRIYADFDPRQVGEDRLSAVQYVRFDTRGRVPSAVGSDLSDLTGETQLTDAQRRALAEDLASDV